MTLLTPRSTARTLPLLTALLAGAAIAVGCGSDPEGHSIFEGAGGQSQGGTGGSTGSTNPTTGAGAGAGAGAASSSASGSSSSGGVQQATFTVQLEASSIPIDLATSIDVNVAVQPNGYKGNVTLKVGSFGPGVTAVLKSTNVTLDGATTANTTLTITTTSAAPPGDTPFTVSAIVAAGTRTADATLTVESAITITIPAGVDGMAGTLANPYKMAFGPYPTNITAPAGISGLNPVTVRFYNADNKAHQIHAGQNAQGFIHDPAPIAPNSMDPVVRNVNAKGTYDYYLHDEGSAITVGRIVIQ
jgi:hypothetical protein